MLKIFILCGKKSFLKISIRNVVKKFWQSLYTNKSAFAKCRGSSWGCLGSAGASAHWIEGTDEDCREDREQEATIQAGCKNSNFTATSWNFLIVASFYFLYFLLEIR